LQCKVLLAGFGRNSRSAIEKTLSSATLDVTSVRFNAKMLVERELLKTYDVLVLEARPKAALVARQASTALDTASLVSQIRKAKERIGIVLIGTLADASGASSSRENQHGADAYLTEPLNQQDAAEIVAVHRKNVQLDSGESGAEDEVAKQPSATGRSFLKPSMSLDSLAKVRIPISDPVTEDKQRSSMQKAAISRMFAHGDGRAGLDELESIVSLLRLPNSLAPFFLWHFGTSDLTKSIDQLWFLRFWDETLAEAGQEERLFFLLAEHPTRGFVTVTQLRHLVLNLFQPRKCNFKSVDFFSDYVDIAFASLCFEISGSISRNRPAKKSEVVRAKTCSSLLAAENGMYQGPFSDAREPIMQSLRFEFYCALNAEVRPGDTQYSGPLAGPGISVVCFCLYNESRKFLTPAASTAVLNYYGIVTNGQRCLTLCEFTRFWKAITTVGSMRSTEYFWPILDEDLDGFVSRTDLIPYFVDKASILDEQGLSAVDLTNVYLNVCDMCGAAGQLSAGLSLADLRRACDRDRSFFVRSMLFREDDLIVVDIKRSLESSAAKSNS